MFPVFVRGLRGAGRVLHVVPGRAAGRAPSSVVVAAVLGAGWLAGCATPAAPPEPPAGASRADLDVLARRIDDDDPASLDELATQIATDLARRAMPEHGLPALEQPGRLVVLPVVLARGGVQTSSTRQLTRALAPALRRELARQFVQPLSRRAALDSQWAVATAIVSLSGDTAVTARSAPAPWPVHVPLMACAYLVRLANGHIASWTARGLDSGVFDLAPLPFDRDRPVLPSQGAALGPRPRCLDEAVLDPAGIGRDAALAIATVQPAIDAYDANQRALARQYFNRAFSGRVPERRADRETVLNGRYLAALRAGGVPGTPAALSVPMQLVLDEARGSAGIAFNAGFAPGSTAVIVDRPLAARQADWYRAIARRAAARQHCLHVVAHGTARSEGGADPAPVAWRRAEVVRDLITGAGALDAASVRGFARIDAGSRSGLGTGDVRDQWDRHVELQEVPC